jgi:hypothetical protein
MDAAERRLRSARLLSVSLCQETAEHLRMSRVLLDDSERLLRERRTLRRKGEAEIGDDREAGAQADAIHPPDAVG